MKLSLRCLTVALSCLMLVLSAFTPRSATAHDVAELEKVDCRFELPDNDLKVECYLFAVPEDRNNLEGTHIHLAAAVIHSRSANPEPDPVIYLHGGPGGNALAEASAWYESPILDKRDIILLDQRGVGYSDPGLFCPPPADPEPNEKQDVGIGKPPDDMAEVEACKKALTDKGIKLSAYNTRESAIDVHMLREALGYKQWNLYGVSYGTKLALTVARDFPVGVRTMILDGVYPLEVNAIEEDGKWTVQSLKKLFENCAANTDCNKAYPDLENVFYDLIENLNNDPAQVEYSDGTFPLTGNDVYSRIGQLLYIDTAIIYLPKTIYAMHEGDYTALDDLEAEAEGEEEPQGGRGVRRQDEETDYSDADGLYNSVECADEIQFNNRDKALANVASAPKALQSAIREEIENYYDTCRIWGVPASDAKENKRVESEIPSLIFSGEYDPVTPPEWAESAAQGLKTHHSFVFAGGGHGQLGECADGIILAFLDDPIPAPNGECTEMVFDPEFVTD